MWRSKFALSDWLGHWLIQQLLLPYKPWPGIERVQSTRWHIAFALCCRSNATRASIVNPPNSAQLYALPIIPPSYIQVRAVVWACGRGQTHRRAWAIYISRRLRLARNVITIWNSRPYFPRSFVQNTALVQSAFNNHSRQTGGFWFIYIRKWLQCFINVLLAYLLTYYGSDDSTPRSSSSFFFCRNSLVTSATHVTRFLVHVVVKYQSALCSVCYGRPM